MSSFIERRNEAYLSGDERTIREFFASEGIKHLPDRSELWRCIYTAVVRINSYLPDNVVWSNEVIEEEDVEDALVNNTLGFYTWEEISRRAIVGLEGQGCQPLPREASYVNRLGATVKIPYYFYGKTPDAVPPRAK
jgi:hypothetical protein